MSDEFKVRVERARGWWTMAEEISSDSVDRERALLICLDAVIEALEVIAEREAPDA